MDQKTRPFKLTDPEKVRKAIEGYFCECKGKMAVDQDGHPIRNNSGKIVYDGEVLPSIPGLCLALDIYSKQTFYSYIERLSQLDRDGSISVDDKKILDSLTRARMTIEKGYTDAAADRDKSKGALFLLSASYGYSQRQEIDLSGSISVDLTD